MRFSFSWSFFVSCCSFRSIALQPKRPRSRAASGRSLRRAPRPAPCGSRAGEGRENETAARKKDLNTHYQSRVADAPGVAHAKRTRHDRRDSTGIRKTIFKCRIGGNRRLGGFYMRACRVSALRLSTGKSCCIFESWLCKSRTRIGNRGRISREVWNVGASAEHSNLRGWVRLCGG